MITKLLHPIYKKKIGNTYQVLNLGVGGYGADQVYKVSKQSEFIRKNSTLIWVISENDFRSSARGVHISEFKEYLTKFKKLKDNGLYDDIIYVFLTYAQRSFKNIITTNNSWNKSDLGLLEARNYLHSFGKDNKLKVIDWVKYIEQHKKSEKTMFAGLEFYYDRAHLSKLGNRTIAKLLYEEIK